MNKYGHMAMRHWEKTDPQRYQQIPDKQAFFAELGETAEIEIQQLQDALAGPDPPGESYLQKVGRLNMARLQAEEQVLSETVLIPGPQMAEDEDEDFKDEAVARHLEFMRGADKEVPAALVEGRAPGSLLLRTSRGASSPHVGTVGAGPERD